MRLVSTIAAALYCIGLTPLSGLLIGAGAWLFVWSAKGLQFFHHPRNQTKAGA